MKKVIEISFTRTSRSSALWNFVKWKRAAVTALLRLENDEPQRVHLHEIKTFNMVIIPLYKEPYQRLNSI